MSFCKTTKKKYDKLIIRIGSGLKSISVSIDVFSRLEAALTFCLHLVGAASSRDSLLDERRAARLNHL